MIPRRDFLMLLGVAAAGCAGDTTVGEPGSETARSDDGAFRDWLDRLPKVELHVHLEGAVPRSTLWEIVSKYGGDASVRTFEDFERQFVYRDFPHFLETWTWMTGFLREYDDFTHLAQAVAQDFRRQNIHYAEVFFSPSDYSPHGLVPQRLAQAIRQGLDDVASVRVALVADLVRDTGPRRAMVTLEQVAEVRDLGVIGIGLGGSEQRFPPELFEAVYARARDLRFFTSAHAGEGAGPESVWGAIRTLNVDRIGHATRAVEDPTLVSYLAAERVPLELCPLSNVKTGVIDSLEDHPVRRYFELRIPVSLNTDDPAFFGNSLGQELMAAHRVHGFGRQEILQLIDSAVDSSWLSTDAQADLRARFHQDPAWTEEESLI